MLELRNNGQSPAVNTLQGFGAQQIKRLADSLDSEAARTALQGLLAGASAATQGQNAPPAALGASASVVLNNLMDSAYGEPSSQLTAEEREARKNLVTTLIAGTTHALGGNAALANTAAAIEVENNGMGGMMSAGIDLAIAMDPNISLKEKADLYKGMAANELEMSALLGGFPCLVARNLLYDLQALRQGETTLAGSAQQRGVEYVTGTLVTAMTMTGLNLVYQQGKLVIAPIAKNIQQSAAIQSSRQVVHTALSKMGINPATQGASKTVATASGQLGKEAAQVTVQTSGINVKIPPGNPLSNAGQVAAKPPGVSFSSSAAVVNNLEKLPWNSWQQYEKIAIDGRQYAQIGKRLYSQHAVDRMQPSVLGAPAGAIGPGRNVTPNMVENIIQNGTSQHNIVDGTSRTIYWHGSVGVVTENHGNTVITMLRRGG